MRRTLSTIALAVLTVGLLGSCSKINERLDNLDKRVDGIENEKIATINTQIDGIKNSIKDLDQIRSDISNLKQTAESHGQNIFDLQEADEALGNRIDNLEDYLENVLPNYAEKEWVKATFSTLEQYDTTCTALAEINVKIGELDTKIAKDIETCADSLTEWINVKFKGYYTAAEMDAKLAQMKASVDSAKASGKITDTKADSIARELTKTKTAVDTAKSHIRSEYKVAIKTAIETSEGKLTKELTDKIATVNTAVTNLTKRVDNIQNKVDDLLSRVEALENMIQSVTIVPAFSDGSVKLEDDILLSFDFIISPLEVAGVLKKEDISILLKTTGTKAVELDTVPDKNIKYFSIDTASGIISISASVLEFISGSGNSLTTSVNVNNGKSDFTTNFVNVTSTHGYVEIAAKYDGETITTLKWAKQNLAVTQSGRKEFNHTGYFNGDYFQWAASYDGYNITDPSEKKPENLVIYDSFTSKLCEDDADSFVYKGEKRFSYEFDPFYVSGSGKNRQFSRYNESEILRFRNFNIGDDAANICWGGSWRVPTIGEIEAMQKATLWQWDETDKGYYVFVPNPITDAGKVNTSTKKNSVGEYDKLTALLFFPAAGCPSSISQYISQGVCAYILSRSYLCGTDRYEMGAGPIVKELPIPAGSGHSIRPVAN